MAPLQHTVLLPRVREIAWLAGAEILKFYRRDFSVREKADRSPVTEADEAAEKIIIPALQALAPDVPVVAEEMMAGGAKVNVGDGPFGSSTLRHEGVRRAPTNSPSTSPWGIMAGAGRRSRAGARGDPRRRRPVRPWRAGATAERGTAARRPPADGVATASRRHGDQTRWTSLAPKVKETKITGLGQVLLIAAGEATPTRAATRPNGTPPQAMPCRSARAAVYRRRRAALCQAQLSTPSSRPAAEP
jgi:3'(2'), 5'-bisphosphate nucleotidase